MTVESRAMFQRVAILLSLLLSACGAVEEPKPSPTPGNPDWVVRSHVEFLESDAKTSRAMPAEKLRLWLPYVVGDLYGAPNAGEVIGATLGPDLQFSFDLNQSLANLQKSLVATAFSQKWMLIEPADARVARLSVFVMPAQGIVPVGTSEWLDADSGARLMLIYLDRPAKIRGDIVFEGRSLRFDIDARQSGYLWIRQPDGSGEFRAVPRPARLVLAVMPNA
jgi:hypothetical protein